MNMPQLNMFFRCIECETLKNYTPRYTHYDTFAFKFQKQMLYYKSFPCSLSLQQNMLKNGIDNFFRFLFVCLFIGTFPMFAIVFANNLLQNSLFYTECRNIPDIEYQRKYYILSFACLCICLSIDAFPLHSSFLYRQIGILLLHAMMVCITQSNKFINVSDN